MATGKNGEADGVGALLFRGRDDLCGREADAVIDRVHADGAGARGDLFGAVGVAVEAGFADQEGERAPEFFAERGDVALYGFGVLIAGFDDQRRRRWGRDTRRRLCAARRPIRPW